ncbi:hypothetical protein L2E82_38750 [Cichorium intybus]|uniref:Uncharacterized protein n=1 Tax=Cichorium intybus TaxID=13427 RepID=A0ACB9AG82_CICIN|nr:hypothetical protein L2E82_38750 [Cichorium intybus]
MRKSRHLLNLGRSKGLFLSNRTWTQQSSRVNSHHLRRYPQQPLSPLSSYSRHYLHATLGNLKPNVSRSHYSTLQALQLDYNNPESPVDYEVIVKGRDVISAALNPTYKHWLPLSNLDLLLPPVAAGAFFCYKKKDGIAMSPETVVNTIRTSLARVLATFYPLAGEIVQNTQGEPELLCNNSGVEFVHAQADIELKDLDFHRPDDSVKGKLVPMISRGVFSVQVTELRCGSMIMACSIDHRVGDGQSMNMFLVSLAEIAQMKPITNIPCFRTSILNPRKPPRYDTTVDSLYMPISFLPPPASFQDKLYSRIYYMTAESINQIQCEASSKERRRSKLQSFTAFLWKLLAHGDDCNVSTTSRMGIVVNGRKFLDENSEKVPSLMENHFGNVLSIPYGTANNNVLKTMPLNKVADEVHKFLVEATKEEHFRGLIDWVELHRPEPAVAKIYFGLKEIEGEATVVSSGQGLPITDLDFGWGKPDFGSYHFPWGSQSGYLTTMPSARKNGDWVIYMHLKQKDLDLIESMAPHVLTPLNHSHLSF